MKQGDHTIQQNSDSIVVYQSSDGVVQLDVQLADETVWLTQKQMAWLFDTKPQNITIHIGNIYKEEELEQDATCKDFLQVQTEGGRTVRRMAKFYNLDVIISVGYRVKSKRGTQFRQWANRVLKEYLLKGYSINNRLERLEQRVSKTEEKIDFFVRTALPPVEGVFYNGQIFDAYVFAADLIKSAKKSITLVDNYIDESVLLMLSKRKAKVRATIITRSDSKVSQLDIEKHNAQYSPVEVKAFDTIHDRFLIIGNDIYHIGASLKDLGKKLFTFSKLEMPAETMLKMTALMENRKLLK